MNEITQLLHQVRQLQLILENIERTLSQLAKRSPSANPYPGTAPVSRFANALPEMPVPRQSEFATYARQDPNAEI